MQGSQNLKINYEEMEKVPTALPQARGQCVATEDGSDAEGPTAILSGRNEGVPPVPFNDASTPFPDPGPPPDGGLTAWVQALMGFLVILISWGYLTSFGIFQEYYVTELHSGPSAITWLGSVETWLIFFVGTFSGRALDAGLFRPVFISGVVCTLLGTFLSSVARNYWELFLTQGLLIGLGDGMMFTPAIGLVSTYFNRRRSMVMAFAACGGATGGMIFPAMVRSLLPKIGFGWTVRAMGFFQMGIAALLIALLKPRLPPRRSGPLIDWEAFRDAPYILFVIGMFFNWWALYFAFYYTGAYGRDIIGISYAESINILIMLNGLGAAGRFLPAVAADLKFGPLNSIIPPGIGAAALMYGWVGVHSRGALWAFAALDGLVPNGVQGLWPATLASLTQDITKTGTRLGMGFTIVSFACLTGPPLGGALIEMDKGGYLYAQMWAGSSFLCGSMFIVAARICKSGWVWRSKV